MYSNRLLSSAGVFLLRIMLLNLLCLALSNAWVVSDGGGSAAAFARITCCGGRAHEATGNAATVGGKAQEATASRGESVDDLGAVPPVLDELGAGARSSSLSKSISKTPLLGWNTVDGVRVSPCSFFIAGPRTLKKHLDPGSNLIRLAPDMAAISTREDTECDNRSGA